MNRDEFEKLFPVPKHVIWDEANQRYITDDAYSGGAYVTYNAGWQGFQSGYSAGLERAAEHTEKYGDNELAAAIRALKGGER